MFGYRLENWTQQRLRLYLLLFFVVLTIPTSILVTQTYSQLKWEAFHRHRLSAEQLIARIDQEYSTLISLEDARPFTDYVFFNVAGDDKESRRQRSQLSTFPVQSNIPGVLGYFQIDHLGHYSTPLIPEDKDAASGIGKDELGKRQALDRALYQVLNDNQILQSRVSLESPPVSKAGSKAVSKAGSKANSKTSSTLASSQEGLASDTIDAREVSLRQRQNALNNYLEKAEVVQQKNEISAQLVSQRAFDQLGSTDSHRKEKILGRVEDLQLEKSFSQNEKKYRAKSKRAPRKEQNVLPSPPLPYSTGDIAEFEDKSPLISIFESEIESFEFSVLNSGHLVLYRRVWRDEKTYIQGMLIEAEVFIGAIIQDSFYKSDVSLSSKLAIAFEGNVLSALSSQSQGAYLTKLSDLQGNLLLEARLSAPLDRLQLLFSVNNLPPGPGGSLLAWTTAILTLVFCGSFILMYRLGMRQIILTRQQQDFVSAVSHELKTPLTSIRMYGEMLREGWVSAEKQKVYYDYIFNESERLSRLINNVLQLARMTRNDLKPNLSPYLISALLDNLKSKLHSQCEVAGFELAIDNKCVQSEQTIEVDVDYFSQIFINLVDNAIKYSSKAPKKLIEISCHQLDADQLQFCVRDFGPGIAKDQMRKIFKLFYRSGNELTRETVGTGIGLSLVQELVYTMKGEIDVVNQAPGVEFRISFPLIKASNA